MAPYFYAAWNGNAASNVFLPASRFPRTLYYAKAYLERPAPRNAENS